MIYNQNEFNIAMTNIPEEQGENSVIEVDSGLNINWYGEIVYPWKLIQHEVSTINLNGELVYCKKGISICYFNGYEEHIPELDPEHTGAPEGWDKEWE